MNFWLDNWGSGSCCHRLVTVLRERLAGKHKRFFGGVARSGGPTVARTLGTPIVEAALLGTAGFETARLLAAIVKAARVSA
jgi:hypothetical protein